MKQSSIYQRVVEINMARSSHPWMNLFSLKMWRHRTSEKRLWHFESKNRSTAESRFGRPKLDIVDSVSHETIRRTLKKTNLNPGKRKSGVFRQSKMPLLSARWKKS